MINVILADQQAIYCAGMAKVLAVEEDIRIVGQPQFPEQLLNGMERLRPRIVVLASSFQSSLPQVQEIARRYSIAVLMLCDNSETASDFMRLGIRRDLPFRQRQRCGGGDPPAFSRPVLSARTRLLRDRGG